MNPLPWTVLLLITLGSLGCKKQIEAPSTSERISRSDSVNLSAEWPMRQVITQEFHSTSSSAFPDFGGRGGSGGRDTEIQTTYTLAPIAGTNRIATVLDFELVDFTYLASFGGRNFSIGGGMESLEPVSEAAEKAYKSLPGTRLRLALNSTNYLMQYSGRAAFDEKINRVMSGGQGGRGGGRMGGNPFSDAFFRQLARVDQPLPNKETKPGESWDSLLHVEIVPRGLVPVPVACEFVGWEKIGTRELARVDYHGELPKPAAPQGGRGGNRGFGGGLEEGKLKGSSWFDPQFKIVTDWALEIDGSFQLVMGPGGFGGGPRGGNTNQIATTNQIPVKITMNAKLK